MLLDKEFVLKISRRYFYYIKLYVNAILISSAIKILRLIDRLVKNQKISLNREIFSRNTFANITFTSTTCCRGFILSHRAAQHQLVSDTHISTDTLVTKSLELLIGKFHL